MNFTLLTNRIIQFLFILNNVLFCSSNIHFLLKNLRSIPLDLQINPFTFGDPGSTSPPAALNILNCSSALATLALFFGRSPGWIETCPLGRYFGVAWLGRLGRRVFAWIVLAAELALVGFLDYVLHHFGEALVLLGGGLEVFDFVVLGHLLALRLADLPLVDQIYLVSAEHHVGCRVGVLRNRLHPGRDGVEGLLVGHVEGDDYSVGAPVEVRRQRPEALLPRRVPYFY